MVSVLPPQGIARSRSFTPDNGTVQSSVPSSRQTTPRGGGQLAWMPTNNPSYVPPPNPSYVPPPQWPMQSNPVPSCASFIPPPVQNPSYVPPPVLPQHSSAAPTANNSYVPPPMPMPTGNNSFVPPPVAIAMPTVLQTHQMGVPPMPPPAFPPPQIPDALHRRADLESEKYSAGVEVVIGHLRFRCVKVLGRGSFSEVWSAQVLSPTPDNLRDVALKEIFCQSKADLQQALIEANLLERIQSSAPSNLRAPGVFRIPRYLSHKVDQMGSSWRFRMAMSRMPGEPLDAFLKRTPPPGDGPSAVRRGCVLAMQLIRQIGPTLEHINNFAQHRDVNSHNLMISDFDALTNATGEWEEHASHVSFWLIDFGLAVESSTWPFVWHGADVGGDCRYWPPASWMMSFHGADDLAAHRDLHRQYLQRLDSYGLGITALEVLCTTALGGSHPKNGDSLRGSWRRLLTTWSKYWHEVEVWHQKIFNAWKADCPAGGHRSDIGPLYQQMVQDRAVEKVQSRVTDLRACLRACILRAQDPSMQTLLGVLAELLDESSTFGLREAVQAITGQGPPPRSVATHIGGVPKCHSNHVPTGRPMPVRTPSYSGSFSPAPPQLSFIPEMQKPLPAAAVQGHRRAPSAHGHAPRVPHQQPKASGGGIPKCMVQTARPDFAGA
eukprot:gnl/TRDRNA2_/TRDRNA2_72796_c0_seq1.p1 gnl/TRDRNA2_/TRDRNA2_72796_c0~~gnl/TRDRNA2_/TRDRNA2_72796_c0_seq1.p1  ORF type:complete len:697 (+),score=98.16 gnl/TRDRNA2_/TRDRNA2_72796_c0_seq1:104-2092(+)